MLCQTMCVQCFIYISDVIINMKESNIGFIKNYAFVINKNISSVVWECSVSINA